MSTPIIAVENLCKKYIIGETIHGRGARTFRDIFDEKMKQIFSKKEREQKKEETTIWALKDVSFDVNEGDVVGIIGRNGAGKSTLLKILSRITEPTEGRVTLSGRVASLLEVGTGFNTELTGRENIYLNGAILGMRRAEIRKKFDEIVAFAEIEKFLDTPVKRYSSGMYVRLAFAVAAHLEPDVLVVDEVLAVGDAQFQKKCLGKMKDVSTNEGRTVMFVSHNMNAIKNLCAKTILFEHGELVLFDDTNKVVESYLGREFSTVWSQDWPIVNEAPGNNFVKLKSVALDPQVTDPDKIIDVRTPLLIECIIWNFLDNVELNLSLHLFNIEGECVFNVGTGAKVLDKGLFKGICKIPGNFLNDGVYSISIMVVKDKSVCLHNFENVLSFEVQDFRENAAWFGKWPGAVRPNFVFTLEKLNSVQHEE